MGWREGIRHVKLSHAHTHFLSTPPSLHPPSPAHALVVLQLADDLDVFALLTQHLPDSVHVGGLANERGEDHVDALLHAELQVLNVLLRHGGQVHGCTREVHSLLAAEHPSVLNLTHQEVGACGTTQGERAGGLTYLKRRRFERMWSRVVKVCCDTYRLPTP